jgi:hypothetical protein
MTDPSIPASDDVDTPVGLRRWLDDAVGWLRGFVYGMTTYDMAMTLQKERADRETLFVLISFGDLLGVPILPPYYSLRLLPFIVPLMGTWKHRLLRERDLTDIAGMID